ncbi:hypothetical protein FH041_09710 [Pseudomonas sp. SWI7]|uniref:hypothetical protein n=1 Tax=Pseudomonas sp. SWI7 TaxID=2587597 RepID=UPI00111EB23C|nr:hypothetical protein [Pseudomonas sp. SWI7]QDC05182.1 hypothetical protein FH041_09710 [Pseudomonas sp. SWI7]
MSVLGDIFNKIAVSEDEKIAREKTWHSFKLFLGLCVCALGLVTGAATIQYPGWLTSQLDNPTGPLLILIGLLSYFWVLYNMAFRRNLKRLKVTEDVYVSPAKTIADEIAAFNKVTDASARGELQAIPHLDTPFEDYVGKVVYALDARINLSENKAKELLSSGKAYLFWGIACYAIAIVLWQIAEHVWGYSHFLLLGMISTSVTFFVVEFLAAWFLKQYRSYVDSSIVYLSVRSAFNRYLLMYYTVNQFSGNPESLKVLVDMLGEEIKWPTHKDISSNDFNYMMESMGTVVNLVDKLKNGARGQGKASGE